MLNYTKQYIYKHIIIKYPKLSEKDLQIKLQSIFKEIINKIRYITLTNELDSINTPMGFLFQHIRKDIVDITANCVCLNDKIFLDKYLLYNFEWNIRLFNCLKTLNAKDIIVWFFLQIPYYNNDNTQNIIVLYEKLLDYFLINWTSDIYLTENEFIYISNETCMPYTISYHNQNNVSILVKYCKLLRKICPSLNYYSPKLSEKILHSVYNNSKLDTLFNTKLELNKIKKTNTLITNISKIKICFISDCFVTDSSVLRDRISIIGKLDRTKYDVYIASFIPLEKVYGTVAKIFMNKLKDNYIYLGVTNKQHSQGTTNNFGFKKAISILLICVMQFYCDLGKI